MLRHSLMPSPHNHRSTVVTDRCNYQLGNMRDPDVLKKGITLRRVIFGIHELRTSDFPVQLGL
jgi:hypothetical protein